MNARSFLQDMIPLLTRLCGLGCCEYEKHEPACRPFHRGVQSASSLDYCTGEQGHILQLLQGFRGELGCVHDSPEGLRAIPREPSLG